MSQVVLKPARVQTKSISAWEQGVVTAYDVSRTPEKGLSDSGNVYLTQNGTIRPRPSMVLYGAQPLGTVLGEIYEYRNTASFPILNWRICMQNVGGTTQVYVSKDLGAWTVVTGKTYNGSAKAHFLQLNTKVLVMNGTDTLSYFDIATNTVIPFSALTTPSAPTLTTNTGLTGTSFTITYRISANSTIGETIASTALSTTVSTDRDMWNATTQSLAISWTAVTGAKSYNVYMGVGGIGTEFLIASGITGLTYTDNGTAYQDTTHSYPLVDSTAGPAATRADLINGQVFLTGISTQIYNVIAGGTYPYQLDFSPANGGTTIPISQGGKDIPVRVKLAPGGTSSIKVYTTSTNGKGSRYTLTPDTLTVGSQTISFFDVNQDNGDDGTNSPDSFIYYQNQNYYASSDGFKTDGVLPQLQTFLSTRRTSSTINPDINGLNTDAMQNAVGLGYDGRLFSLVPYNSTTNNQMWVLDIDRGGGWMKPWNIAGDWMMLYNSNTVALGGDGNTHFIVLSNNSIYELDFSYQHLTADNNIPFSTSGTSGRIYFSPDQRVCAKLLNVIFTFSRPVGAINVGVNGQFRDNDYSYGGTLNVSSNTTISGWGEAAWSDEGWGEIGVIPITMNLTSKDVKVKVNKEVRWWQYNWNSIIAGTDYALTNVTAEYVITGIRDL